jgi:hypothetical protein
MLAGRGYLEEALRWMEIHGGVQGQELASHWRSLDLAEAAAGRAPIEDAGERSPEGRPRTRRRRRRRRRGPQSSGPAPTTTA